MNGAPSPYEALIARLATEPDSGLMARPGAPVLVWDLGIERLLWASPAAEGLGEAFTDKTGRLVPDLRARDRLRALAAGAAPRDGARLERLRLNPIRPWQPVPCACRLAALENGEEVLVTALLGAVPQGFERPSAPSSPQAEQEVFSEPAHTSSEEALPPQEKPRGSIRFVWQADAEARFTQVSPALAEAVGPRAGDIVGRTWDELTRTVVFDPGGEIAGHFARGETWSARTVYWAMDDQPMEVPVDWGGMPVFGTGREISGFRGFGLLRMNEVRERKAPGLPAAAAEVEPFLTDAALPFSPPEEAQTEGQDTLEEASQEDENWFAHLRDRVAEALASTKPIETSSEPTEGGRTDDADEKAQPAPASSLSSAERNAFREIARALGARLEEKNAEASAPSDEATAQEDVIHDTSVPAEQTQAAPVASASSENADPILDRLPIGILIHRGERILFANRFLLDLTGYGTVEQVMGDGGLVQLFRGSPALNPSDEDDTGLALTTRDGENIAVAVRASEVEWSGEPAQLMLIRRSFGQVHAQTAQDSRVQELEAILDTATDGVILFDETGRILSLNRSAEALFGYHQREVAGSVITVLLAPESHKEALDYLEGLRSPGVASLLNDGREVLGRERQGGTIPLFMTMGQVCGQMGSQAGDGANRKFCAVLRDMTTFKKAEGELVGAKRAAEEASAQKSDLLAKISHEIRTPLNAIIGFAEVMLEERFGSIGNERYKEYLRDVHASGSHVISLVNDLLDLAKIEAGRLELSFTGVNLNDLVSSCVTLLQPQAMRDRIVMRTSFASKLPPVVADERSVRQIALNLVSNAIKFTDAGGQVIVSTAMTDRGEVAFRVRDTGIGMTAEEVEAALEPFRQIATSRKPGGTGLGLPLTKALVEANRGSLQIASNPKEGTLVEVIFPPTRVLAE
jgi:PAS domain S-box-containing protein